MSLVEVVDDLITLQDLAEHEGDEGRRRSLDEIRTRVAGRDRGAKVSDVASLLGISAPTVRSWIDAGVLRAVEGSTPRRIDVLSLAAAKRAVDLLRKHGDDRHLLAEVMRVLRDEAALDGDIVRAGLEDLEAGRTVPLGDDLLDEIETLKPRRKPRSKSS